MSRIKMRQQLMRDQWKEEEEKEKTLSRIQTQSTSAVDVPISSSVPIPRQVVTFQSKLSNPTDYHVEHSQKRQVHEFLSQSHFTRANTCLPQTVVETTDFCSYSENLVSVMNTSATGDQSKNEPYNDFFDDFNDITSSIADSGVDHGFPAIVEKNMTLALFSPEDISAYTEEYESYNEKSPISEKERSKKDAHNEVERKRRNKINNSIMQLKAELPKSSNTSFDSGKGKVKGEVLQESVAYIRSLKEEVKLIPELKEEIRKHKILTQKLLSLIQNHESTLKLHNIPVDQSIWHPSSESDIKALIKEEPNYVNGITCSSVPQISSKSVTRFNGVKLMKKSPHDSNHCLRPGRPTVQFLTVQSIKSNSAPNDFLTLNNATCSSLFNSSNLDFFENNHVITEDVMLQPRESSTPEDMDVVP